MSPLLSHQELHQRFLDALGSLVVRTDSVDDKPLTLEASPPLPSRLRVYLFNSTNPPGGRSGGEHKIQLIVGPRGDRGNFDFSEERAVVVAGYESDYDAFILWDASRYHSFAYSRNVQVRTDTIEEAVTRNAVATQTRSLGSGDLELVIAVPSARLIDGLVARFDASPNPIPAIPPDTPRPARSRGRRYVRTEPAEHTSRTRVFEVDPNAIDRGTKAHKDTQDALSVAVDGAGLEALEATGTDPQFDIAWLRGDVAFVTEVKSLTDENEERQLRLAVGQVLSYAYLLDWEDVAAVQPVIAVEREPNSAHWIGLCARHGVQLVWPETFGTLF